MNQVILIGNLTATPETRKMQDGTVRCSFRVAVQRDYKNSQTGERDADFITVITWRQLADVCGKYLAKGRKVGVIGSLRSRTYDGTDGAKHYVTEVYADKVSFCGGKNESGGDNKTAPVQTAPQAPAQTAIDGFGEIIGDSDLPF